MIGRVPETHQCYVGIGVASVAAFRSTPFASPIAPGHSLLLLLSTAIASARLRLPSLVLLAFHFLGSMRVVVNVALFVSILQSSASGAADCHIGFPGENEP